MPHAVSLSLFQIPVKWFKFFRIKFNPKITLQNIMLLRSETRAACVQSFALWQQATIEIMRRNLSFIACSRHAYVLLVFTHIPFVGNLTNYAMPPERLQQHPILFTTNHTDRTFFVWRLNSARPPHPGHSTIFCDRKSQAACAQSFALWQQVTIEFTRRDHYCCHS